MAKQIKTSEIVEIVNYTIIWTTGDSDSTPEHACKEAGFSISFEAMGNKVVFTIKRSTTQFELETIMDELELCIEEAGLVVDIIKAEHFGKVTSGEEFAKITAIKI